MTVVYRFTIYPASNPDLTSDLLNAIYSAGCDDATVARSNGVSYIHFDREAETYEIAVGSAIAQLMRIGIEAGRVERDEEEGAAKTPAANPLLPIRDEPSLDLAIAEINRLIELHPADLTESDSARLDELGSAVHEYESSRNPMTKDKGASS